MNYFYLGSLKHCKMVTNFGRLRRIALYPLKWTRVITIICCGLALNSTYGDRFDEHHHRKFKNKLYIKLAGGLVLYKKFNSDAYQGGAKNDLSISTGLGYDFHKNISGEILGRFSRLKWSHYSFPGTTSQKSKLYSLFANIYLKYPVTQNIIPYLTLGPGYSFNKPSTISDISDQTITQYSASGRKINSLAWNIGVGSIIKLRKHFSMDITYRYMHLGKIGFKNIAGTSRTEKIKAHDISLGLIYKFY